MPATNVRSRWSGGDLIFKDLSGNELLRISNSKLRANFEASQLKINDTAVTATAAELNTVAGYTGTTAALNAVDNAPVSFTFAAASAGTNVAEVTITAKDADGNTVAAPLLCTVWLSDAATGVGLTSTAASGTVAAKSASGVDFGVLTAKKATVVQTLATGIYILEITDSAKTAFFVAAQAPNGAVSISDVLATGDYG